MLLAIHHTPYSFSERWISYCEKHSIPFKIVDCYSTNIINDIKDCDGLLWHWSHTDLKAMHFARQLTYSLEKSGIKVFPDSSTVWHFDDKVGQKYLLEAIGAPIVPSYVFFEKKDALNWARETNYPKVFKLKAGAGSRNVWLVRNSYEAKRLIYRSFGRGFLMTNPWIEVKDRFAKFMVHKNAQTLLRLLKGFGRLFISRLRDSYIVREKGYAYFQDFIPNNKFDLRVVTIGDRAFVLKRLVRQGDFRASGSGNIEYPGNEIDPKIIKLSFKVSENIKAQCIAYDYVFDKEDNPLIVEISYAFSMLAYDHCKGYWDSNLSWHCVPVNAPVFMIEDYIKTLVK